MGKTALVEAASRPGAARVAGADGARRRARDGVSVRRRAAVARARVGAEGGRPGDAAELVLSASSGGRARRRGRVVRHPARAVSVPLGAVAAASACSLTLDDAQWADPQSLRFLAYIKHRLDGLAVGVVVATRPGRRRAARSRARGPRGRRARPWRRWTSRPARALLERWFGAAVGAGFCHRLRARHRWQSALPA